MYIGGKMKIKEVIDYLETQGEWVNRDCTKDHILYGNENNDIHQAIVCWVATLDIIYQAIQNDCHFIISHENPFYLASTNLPHPFIEAQKKKKELLKKHNITIYRCHDLWDLYPKYGVRDSWGEILRFNFKEMKAYDYIKIAKNIKMSFDDLISHVIKCIEPYHQAGIEVIGTTNKTINRLGIGTGACTDIFTMSKYDIDACIVSDDGINNWVAVQWAMDNEIPLIIVNHMTCEAPGIKNMAIFLNNKFENIEFKYVPNDYGIYHKEK